MVMVASLIPVTWGVYLMMTPEQPEWYAIAGAGLAGGIFLLLWRYWTLRKQFVDSEGEVIGARLSRQIRVVEEQLRRLEVLRKADLETLVRRRVE